MNKIFGMKVSIPEEAKHRMLEAFDTILTKGWLMWGDQQEMLVDKFTEATGKQYGVTFNSATSAFDVLFRFLKRRTMLPEIGFQATAFPSPVFSAERQGLWPRWLDINGEWMVPDLNLLEAENPDGLAVYCPQWTGGFIPRDVDGQAKWCRDNGVVMVEDCSHASGSYQHDQHAGSFGDHAIFSLAATKPLQTGQGGMLVTDDRELAEYAFQMKNYGRDAMFQRGNYVEAGHNLHMTELQAAVGVVLWDYVDEQIKQREAIASALIAETGLVPLGDWLGMPNFYKLAVRIPEKFASREEWKLSMAKFDVEMGSAVYDFLTPDLPPVHFYRGEPYVPESRVHVETHACIPCHNGMGEAEIERVIQACTF